MDQQPYKIKSAYFYISFSLITAYLFICDATAKADSIQSCGNNLMASQLIELIKKHNTQQRTELNCNSKLIEIANIKANLILKSEDIWHNEGNLTPNQLLRHHGFKLPHTYPIFGNQVEALAGGESSVEEVFMEFMNSEPHRKLLMGDDYFFKQQNQIGAAYIEDINTEHQHYWVVIIADEKNNDIKQDPVIDVKPPIYSKKKNRGRRIKDKFYRDKVRGKILN